MTEEYNLPDTNAVRTTEDDTFVLVGEDHTKDDLYSSLFREVAKEVQPKTIAVEARDASAAMNRNFCCAVGEASTYAQEAGVPLIAVDTHWRSLAPSTADLSGLLDTINRTDVNVNGSFDPAMRDEIIEEVVEEYGEEVAHAVWRDREELMAARLLGSIMEGHQMPCLVACGIYHLDPLVERLQDSDHETKELVPRRVTIPPSAERGPDPVLTDTNTTETFDDLVTDATH